MTAFELRKTILAHIRELLEKDIDKIKECKSTAEFEVNAARRDTLFELHSWINEETR